MNRPEARDPHTDAEWLAAALREQADSHEPDRHRIDARFESLIARPQPAPTQGHSRSETRNRAQGRASSHLRPRRLIRLTRIRLIGVPLGVLAVAATATVAVGVSLGITGRTTHLPSQAAPSSSPRSTSPGHQTIPQSSPSGQRPAGSASAHTESSPTGPAVPAGPLAVVGSVDPHSTQYWAQEDLTVTTARPIRALHVVVTVTGGNSVQSTGSWTTILAAEITTTEHRTASSLVYDITLNPGQSLQPGSYAFGLQFNRPAAGHDFTRDAYTVTAITLASNTSTGNTAQASAAGTFSN
jgi:hypothetical protein